MRIFFTDDHNSTCRLRYINRNLKDLRIKIAQFYRDFKVPGYQYLKSSRGKISQDGMGRILDVSSVRFAMASQMRHRSRGLVPLWHTIATTILPGDPHLSQVPIVIVICYCGAVRLCKKLMGKTSC